MKNVAKKITVGKNEAGTAEYQDTKQSIEMGDTAFTIQKEDVITGETNTIYFKEECNVVFK